MQDMVYAADRLVAESADKLHEARYAIEGIGARVAELTEGQPVVAPARRSIGALGRVFNRTAGVYISLSALSPHVPGPFSLTALPSHVRLFHHAWMLVH